MTPQALLEAALRAAEPSESGLQELHTRMGTAENTLNNARSEFAASEHEELQLIERQGAVNAHLVALGREIEKAQREAAQSALETLDPKRKREFAPTLAKLAERRRSLTDQTAVLRDALELIVNELVPTVAIHKTEAEIGIARASRDWVEASAYHDLLSLQLKLGPALHHDRSLSINVGPGSHAHGYAEKLSALDLEIGTLQDRLRQMTVAHKNIVEAA